ncbi:inner membrane protein YhhT [Klebsiella pneumoniae]|nr:inner membrane protein YhhT [Klebsiella pneumoniae]
MSPPQADKAGLHILLKLAALVIILAGIHAAADILVQLLLALFFAIVLNPLVTWFIRRGVRRPFRHYPGGDGDAGDAHRAARRAGGVAQ